MYLVVSLGRVEHMKFTSRYTFAAILSTSLTCSIGRGVERHRLNVSIKPEGDGSLHAYIGQTWCGSQRARSGWHSPSFDAPVTCERCLARPDRESAPARDLLEVVGRRIVVRADVEIIPLKETP